MIPDKLIDWDMGATLWINNGIHGSFSDQLMVFMSDIVIWVPLYTIVAVFLFKELGWKRALLACATAGLVFFCCDQLANLFKTNVGRLRPCYNEEMLTKGLRMLEKRAGLFGFFSGHAANSFGFAVCIIACLRIGSPERKRYSVIVAFGLLWAALLSLSRIVVGKHFFGDVLVGAVIGTLIAFILTRIYKFAVGKLA